MHLRLAIFLLLLTLGAACNSDPKPVPGTPNDAALVAALQGAWCVSDDGGKTCWGFDRFDEHSIHACGRIPENGKAVSTIAAFVITGHTACYTVTASDSGAGFPIGHQFCATVLEINERYQRYFMNGTVFTTYRAPLSSVVCPSAA